jgi:hypothetical protein
MVTPLIIAIVKTEDVWSSILRSNKSQVGY